MKKLLIVSPHFPPINAPDMQRVRMSLPFYERYGWSPTVLTVREDLQDAVLEPELSATIPKGIPIVAAGGFRLSRSRWVGVGNVGLRSWPHLLFLGARLLRREKFDLVFFSNTQFATFALGPLWKRVCGVPYALDVQDPWRTDYYERPGSRKPPGGWKYQITRFLAWSLEGWCFRNAAAAMSVSPDYLADLRARYPSFASVPTDVIRFGASREDLRHAANLPAKSSLPAGEGVVNLVYTGASGPVTPHALTVLFTGLRMYRDKHPEKARRFKLHFVGTTYVAAGAAKPSVLPVAEQCGVADQVFEIPHRIGFLESVRMQEEADALLLLGSSNLAYSPSKVFLYFLTGRPILGLVFQDSVMERLLDELRCAYMVRLRETAPKDDAYAGLERFFDLALAGFPPGFLPTRNEAYFDANFLAEELTRRQCALFDRAVNASEP